MKEAIVRPGTLVEIIESPIPVPNADQLVIKVVCSGCNPKGAMLLIWLGQFSFSRLMLISNGREKISRSQNGTKYLSTKEMISLVWCIWSDQMSQNSSRAIEWPPSMSWSLHMGVMPSMLWHGDTQPSTFHRRHHLKVSDF